MLSRDPKTRIGVKTKEEIKNHEFFSDIDWDQLFDKQISPPINLVDVKQELFEENPPSSKESIKFQDNDYQEKNADYNRVRKFTFVRPQSPKESLKYK
jgi:hypothetical protein